MSSGHGKSNENMAGYKLSNQVIRWEVQLLRNSDTCCNSDLIDYCRPPIVLRG